jgi:hypothetical protein
MELFIELKKKLRRIFPEGFVSIGADVNSFSGRPDKHEIEYSICHPDNKGSISAVQFNNIEDVLDYIENLKNKPLYYSDIIDSR